MSEDMVSHVSALMLEIVSHFRNMTHPNCPKYLDTFTYHHTCHPTEHVYFMSVSPHAGLVANRVDPAHKPHSVSTLFAQACSSEYLE